MDTTSYLGEKAVGVAILIAITVHLIVLLGIRFDLPANEPPTSHTIDINLVIPAQIPEPFEPFQASDIFTPTHTPDPLPPSKASSQEKTKPNNIAKPKKKPTQQTDAPNTVKTQPKPNLAQLLASTQDTINLLTTELNTQVSTHQVKRKTINASTQEYPYAAYLAAWQKKIERVGNLNYPNEARQKKLYGVLLLHVAVRADGSLEQIRLLRSSGHQALDDAAIRIVRLAAPFAPFPPNIRQEVEVLDITRTWQFHSKQGLFNSR